MKIRRINRSTEDTPDTYTLQVTFSASDLKNLFIKAYGEKAIAEEWFRSSLECFEADIETMTSRCDLCLGKKTNIGKWGSRVAMKKGYLIPIGNGQYTINKQILTMKSGRTSAATSKLLDD